MCCAGSSVAPSSRLGRSGSTTSGESPTSSSSRWATWYPELVEHRDRIQEIFKAEEERFSQTLERGLKLFEDIAAKGTISAKTRSCSTTRTASRSS